jgi:hypothetical protein
MVCLRNVCINTLHKGDSDVVVDDDYNYNNNHHHRHHRFVELLVCEVGKSDL